MSLRRWVRSVWPEPLDEAIVATLYRHQQLGVAEMRGPELRTAVIHRRRANLSRGFKRRGGVSIGRFYVAMRRLAFQGRVMSWMGEPTRDGNRSAWYRLVTSPGPAR